MVLAKEFNRNSFARDSGNSLLLSSVYYVIMDRS